MKLKMLQDVNLANKNPALPIWRFKKGEIIETEDEYLCERLFHYKFAQKAAQEKVSKEQIKEVKEEAKLKKKAKITKHNKMHKGHKNKSIVDSTFDAKDLDISIDLED